MTGKYRPLMAMLGSAEMEQLWRPSWSVGIGNVRAASFSTSLYFGNSSRPNPEGYVS